MRPIYSTVTGVANGDVIPLDIYLDGEVALGVDVTGTITFTVEYTYDDIWDEAFNPATATWYAVTGLTGGSADADAVLSAPPRAVRIRNSAGTGSARLVVIQSGLITA
jgi:hypothetical protein